MRRNRSWLLFPFVALYLFMAWGVHAQEATVEASSEPATTVQATPVADACPSSDSLIAFGSNRNGDWDIYIISTDGTRVRNITNAPGEDFLPAWSPDGTQIAFHSIRSGNWDVYVMNVDGTNLRNLTGESTQDYQPSWSPDGSRIVYQSDGNLWVMRADGSQPLQLTDLEGNELTPSWSPDGLSIVFTTNADGDYDIAVLDLNTGNISVLTNNDVNDFLPLWSPDSAEIGYSTTIDEVGHTYVMNADGSNQRPLSAADSTGAMGSWSPDGQFVVVSSSRDGNSDLFIMTPSGEVVFKLTNDPAVDGNAAWSPCIPGLIDQIPAPCPVTSVGDVNLRSGPGINYSLTARMSNGAEAEAIGQARGRDGAVWLQLGDGSWARSDLMQGEGNCPSLPTVEPPPA